MSCNGRAALFCRNFVCRILSDNYFSGTLPSSIFVLPQLKFLDLSTNNLRGAFLPSETNLPTLLTLRLRDNLFSAPFPINPLLTMKRLAQVIKQCSHEKKRAENYQVDIGNNTYVGFKTLEEVVRPFLYKDYLCTLQRKSGSVRRSPQHCPHMGVTAGDRLPASRQSHYRLDGHFWTHSQFTRWVAR